MSNKKIFKELYNQKINKDNNYQMILDKLDKKEREISILKRTVLPIGAVLVFLTLIIINLDNNSPNSNIETYKDGNDKIYITTSNEKNNSFLSDLDIVRKDIDYEKILQSSEYNFLNHIKIPTELNIKTYNGIYIKDYTYSKNQYNILNNYEFIYKNNDKSITLSFSKDNKPLRDYTFNTAKKSTINNTEIIIYKEKNTHISIFTYNNINFDIETINLKEKELIDFLKSIIK